MKTHHPGRPRPSEITPESVYLARRRLLQAGAALPLLSLSGCEAGDSDPGFAKIGRKPQAPEREEQTTFRDASTYNNFYEFGTGKADP
ncbi:MAG: mononuclear molybdenum enzyme YedY, partial [Xanthomonadales bacterium]|nr:mononuclear molybdenum enzyme YedY [Xanthomonadales bacterium]